MDNNYDKLIKSIDHNEDSIRDLEDEITDLDIRLNEFKSQAEEYFEIIDKLNSIQDKTEYKILNEGENTIALKYEVYTDKNYSVFRNGIIQIPNIDYKLNNNEIVFTEPATLGEDKILIQYSYLKDN